MHTTGTDYVTTGPVTARADVSTLVSGNVYLYVRDSTTGGAVTVFLSPDVADALAAQLTESASAQRARKA